MSPSSDMWAVRWMGNGVSIRWVSALSLTLSLAQLSCSPRGAVPPTAPLESSPQAQPTPMSSPLERARVSLRNGDFDEAERFFERARDDGDQSALFELSELYLLRGRHEELLSLLATSDHERARLLRSRALMSMGRLSEAMSGLAFVPQKKSSSLLELEAALLQGHILVQEGKRSLAENQLSPWVLRVGEGAFSREPKEKRARAWRMAGEAAYLLRYFEDANEAFDEAEQIIAADLALLLLRGRLFLEKHDPAQAAQVLSEAQKLAPHHPDVLLFTARFHLESSLSFEEAQKLCQRVLLINPRSTDARAILASIELRDLNLKAADAELDRGLEVNPRDLTLLSHKAAVRFLAEDPSGFDAIVEKVLKLSPGYADLFAVVGDFAEWEHRYPDIEILMRRATRLDPEDSKVRALLGLTLVRAGSDAAGVVELSRSFDLDPFNLRVFNTLDLYEKIIPRDYSTLRRGPFRYRFPKTEAPLLERYVPALLEEAHQKMVQRYGYTPEAPIDIELYSTREQFAVRTSGLPRTAIQGVCFGRKLATVSPTGSPGNLGMTLWHELAHVFHIGLSKNRVPRWFTEGLAEWETAHRDVGWSRELDLSLLQAKNRDSLPHLERMSRAFTRAKTQDDVATAYYASSKIVDWVMETQGEKTATAVLKELGEKRLPNDVVPEVLGASFSELDEQFRGWLSKNLSRFDGQFVSESGQRAAAELETKVQKFPDDPAVALALGLARLSEGNLQAAEQQLKKVSERWPLSKPGAEGSDASAQALFGLSQLRLAEERKQEAQQLIEKILGAGYDGFELRMVLARTLLSLKQADKAEPHLLLASRFDEWDSAPWGLLAALRHARGDDVGELFAVSQLARLEEHDPAVHHRLLELLLAQKKFALAQRAAELALWVDLAGMNTHRLAALAFSQAGQEKRARFEWESALLTAVTEGERRALAESWAGELERLGRHQEASRVEMRVLSANEGDGFQ